MNKLKTRFTRVEQLWNSRPDIRLASSYTLILVVISLIFSVVLYHFAVGQLARGLNHQYWQFNGGAPDGAYQFGRGQVPNQIATNLESGRHSLVLNLVYFNIIILIIGSFLSYWLARRTVKPIESALEAQRRFSSDASHELRTPLAVMQTEIEIALGDPKLSRDDAVQMLASNLDEVKKLNRLSDSLLKLARSEGRTLTLAPVSLSAVASGAVDRLAPAAKSKHITLVNDTSDLSVMGESDSLIELAAILLDNAIKYSPAGTAITLTTSARSQSGWLTITDHGQGIAGSDLPYIFDRFYRADKSRTSGDASGHGLGLSLAKHIAGLNRAEVVATSRLGGGSKFSIKAKLA